MNVINLAENAPDPIEWAIRIVLTDDEFDIAELKFEQPIGEVLDRCDADYFCELLSQAFPRLPNGKSLERDFSKALWESKGTQTFADLRRFLGENYDVVRIEPLSIFGQPCLPAGAFRAIERIVHQIDPKIERFAPSVVITSVIRGRKLRQLLVQLRLLTAGRTKIGRRAEAIAGVASVLTLLSIPMIVGMWLAFMLQLPRRFNPQLISIVFTACTMFGTALICLRLQQLYCYALDKIVGVFPSRSYTFRDLARSIAELSCNK